MIITRDDGENGFIIIWPSIANVQKQKGAWQTKSKTPCRIFYSHEHALFRALFGFLPAPGAREYVAIHRTTAETT